MASTVERLTDFATRSRWGFADVAAAALSALLLFWWVTPWVFPASQFIQIQAIQVQSGAQGEVIPITVYRVILRDTERGCYEVDVRNAETGSAEYYAKRCRPYVVPKDRSVIINRDLEWWVASDHGTWARDGRNPGHYVLMTRHCWQRFVWAREACNPWTASNVFEIYRREM